MDWPSTYPADGLKPALKRGPTPAGPSYTITRKSLKIVGATTGANNDKEKASYDDNELTDWVNNGNVATAWIKYELAEKATVNEVELKLNNFRSRVYPIKILVDGKEVFNGLTEKSLGYCTLTCKPIKGKTVTIQLTNGNITQSTTDASVELNVKKLDDGGVRDNKNAKGTLSIIEAEIYTKP